MLPGAYFRVRQTDRLSTGASKNQQADWLIYPVLTHVWCNTILLHSLRSPPPPSPDHLQPVLCLLLAYENIVLALSNVLPDESPLVLIGRTTRGEGRAVCVSCGSFTAHSIATEPNADISVTLSPVEFERAALYAGIGTRGGWPRWSASKGWCRPALFPAFLCFGWHRAP